MINGMYLSTMGGMVQMTRHATIANNLANVNTGGFKPDFQIFRSVDAESTYHGSMRAEIDRVLERTGGGVWVDRTYTDFTHGTVTETGNPLDVALTDDKSFFRIRVDGTAEERYTRDGHFTIDAAGQLRLASGALVLSANGNPITIPVGSQPAIDELGNITDAANANAIIEQLGVMQAGDPNAMKKLGDNLYEAEEGAALTPNQAGVLSGRLEGSAADPIREMVAMIEASRTYESNMKFLAIQDDTLGETVRRISATA